MTQFPRLLERVRQVARLQHFSPKTEKSYLYYIKDFILFHHKRHPREMSVDVDFEDQQITVRDGKGKKDRVTMLPNSVIEPLKLERRKASDSL